MRTLIVLLLVLGFMTSSQAQQITELEEAKVNFAPNAVDVSSNLDNYTFIVKESFTGEFLENPIAFMQSNFDIDAFIASTSNEYDEYLITFKNSKGYLEATYDDEGNLEETNQSFKDIVFPLEVRNEIYRKNKGWTMIKNKYQASGKADRIDKEIYKIKLANGNKKQVIKIDPRDIIDSKVASN